MPRFHRRSASTLIIVLFATFPGLVLAGDEQTDFSVTELTAEYAGDLAGLIEAEVVRPLSLATTDLDEDGVPDLVVGYGEGGSGLFVVHFGNVEAIYPSAGAVAGPAFLSQAEVFTSSGRPDLIATGDFDADGHFDLVFAATDGMVLEFRRGDGRGRFAAAELIDIGGRLTTMAVGEVNRRDGLADIVVGVNQPSGPKILVFENPVGALRAAPESIDTIQSVESIELGNADTDSMRDITAVTEAFRIDVRGRDRRLSLGEKQRAEVAEARVIVEPRSAKSGSIKEATPPFAELIGGEIVAHLSMRLNRDALPDSVVITDESAVPVVIKTLSRSTFAVDSTTDDPDFDTGDGVCDTDDSAGDGPCTLRAAIEQANASSGADAIEFDIAGTGPHTIQPLSQLPAITEALTLDGTTEPDFTGTPVIEIDGSPPAVPMNGLVVTGGSSVIRGLAVNRMQRSGSLGHGIYLDVNGGNIIEGNFIGTDPSGTISQPNGFYGIWGYNGPGNTYGGTATAARNLISGQFLNLAHREGNGALIQGNYIGTDISGTASLTPSGASGLYLYSRENYGASPGDDHTVGGTMAGAGNLISGLHTGIELDRDTSGNLVQGNLIGPDANGTLVLGFDSYGIKVLWNENNTIGGTSPAARNVISGSGLDWTAGIQVQECPGTQIQGNYIGTDVAGTVGHAFTAGLQLSMVTSGVTVGGAVPGAGNLIAASHEYGVLVSGSSNLTIQGNAIGLGSTGSPLSNPGSGITIHQSNNITIGGTAPGEGNTISNSGGAGVEIGGMYLESDPGIEVVGNSIHSNTGLGIDIEADGVTPNDAGDADTGSNGWQNFPVVASVTSGGTQVSGTLNSLASAQYELAFYSSSTCDATGYGEGATFLGIDTVTTDASGDAAFTSSLTTAVPLGGWVTATATDSNGSTSEFSACLQYTDTADLALTKDDGVASVIAGGQVTYTIVASNPSGSDDAIGSTVTDAFPVDLSCSWTCVGAGGASCTAGPVTGDINDAADLPVGGTANYTAVCDVAPSASGTISNTATVTTPTGVTDPTPGNNSDTDIDDVLELDLGDAPDPTYPTLHASDGARHVLGGALYLGSSVDADPDGQPTSTADGDDNDGTDDEDGVAFTSPVVTGYSATVDVTASGAGPLNAWIDFNADGDWDDAGEQVFTDEPLAAGLNPLVIAVPATAAPEDTVARFRIDTAGGLAPTGLAVDGEVEDYGLEVRLTFTDIPVTGQTISYAAGDDGTYQAGIAWPEPRFIDHGNGTITDELTGLTWTQDNVSPGPSACNPGIRKTWYDSLAHIDCLNAEAYLGQTDWRLPNVIEIHSLAHLGEPNQRLWLESQGFTLSPYYYWWSSTTPASSLSSAYTLAWDGATYGATSKNNTTAPTVWPVRGSTAEGIAPLRKTGQVRCWNSSFSEIPCAGTGQDGDHRAGMEWPTPRFEVNGDCVTDRMTGLTWTKDGDIFGSGNWTDAIDNAEGLVLCGYDDWRLPTKLESDSLIHFDRRIGPVPPTMTEWWESQGFVNTSQYASWTGTTEPYSSNSAYKMQGRSNKSSTTYVTWPVRGNLPPGAVDLGIAMADSEDPVLPSATVTYTLSVTNHGPGTADSVVVTDTLPSGTTFVSASGTGWACGEDSGVISCTIDSLPVGPAADIIVEITAPANPGPVDNTAIVDGAQGDPIAENNDAVETTTVIAYDFGDAPDPTYPTLLAANGANHVLGSGLYLGALVDDEPDGQPSAGADGDDLDGSDDEDGVVFASTLLAGVVESFQVTASAAGLLDTWIDFNADGDWDDVGEQVFTAESLAAGANALSVAVPLDATTGATFARFRLSSAGGLTPTGSAADGEVEDYALIIDPSAELAVEIADSPDPVPEGGRLSYFISVRNNGQLEATGVVLTDTLPAEVSFVAASLPACVESSGTVTCNLVSVLPGASTAIEIEVDVDYGFEGTMTNSAVAVLNEADPVLANNTEEELTLVVDEPTYIFSDGFETSDTSRWTATGP